MDRETARSTIRVGLTTAGIAIFFFGFAFYVSVLYLA
jgi:preprotein translocase subunit SecE